MERKWIITGLVCVILAIILGAFGAHGLKSITQDESILASFDTATKYQFFQGLGFLIVPFILMRFELKVKGIFFFFLLGTCLFSGSIYALTVAKLEGVDMLKKIAGPLTPIGGMCMILGWFLVLIRTLKVK